MKRWDLRTLAPSSEKLTAREPGADAPRVPSEGRQMPRVLFSTPECRAVVIDLQAGEELGEHHVRERAVLEIVFGRVAIESPPETVECGAGTLLAFEPDERHTIRALTESRLLLLLSPWPAGGHLPANAVAEPLSSTS
jgi:quercetin dioxygenase-like cupin family protein